MRKRKKYNPLKQAQMLANYTLKNSAIGCVAAKGSCQLIDLKTNSIITAHSTVLHLIANLRHNWSVFIAVIGMDAFGSYYMKSKEISVVEPIFQSEMVETLNTHHTQLIKEFNPSQLLSVGWIATPYLKKWEEDEAFGLLEELGALSFKRDDENNIVEI